MNQQIPTQIQHQSSTLHCPILATKEQPTSLPASMQIPGDQKQS